jgi:hypothetical protein
MKITKSYLRKLIKETIQEGWENEQAWTVTMRNSETGKTEKVHVWTGADTEERAKGIASASSRYAGKKQWVADAAELKESNESYIDFEAKKLARSFLKVRKDEGARSKISKPSLLQQVTDFASIDGNYSQRVIQKASDMIKDGRVMESAQKK